MTAALVIVATFASPGVAPAEPGGWDFRLASMPAGVTSGGQLAIDEHRGKLFVTDNTFPATTTKEGLTVQKPNIDVSVVSLAARRPVGSIDLSDQPWGLFKYQSVKVPMPQIADGIAVDSAAGALVTTSAHADGVSIVRADARKATPDDLLAYPGGHPMGVVAAGGRAWVALFSANKVVLLDTATKRQIAQSSVFSPTLVSLDSARHRLYVGNDDHKNRRRNFVAVIDTRTNKVVKEVSTPSNSRPTVDPVTGRVFAASFDTGEVSVIDPDSLRVVKTIATRSTPNQIAVDGKRRLGYLANLDNRSITVIDLDTASVLAVVKTAARVHTLAVDQRTGIVYGSQYRGSGITVLVPSRR
ncbi:YncE family protein [Gordonia asplenii]|uniref:YncE family protein n=1 Tax=Gordonia asplenii TaxID=2725283 RepID=UPI001B7D74ED|nr:YncE family protein [Gordonia asplenii]